MRDNKIGRNDTCHCGSGRKYKKCCMSKNKEEKKEEKTQLDETILKHLPKEPYDSKNIFVDKQDIINEYNSLGYVVNLEEFDYDVGEFGDNDEPTSFLNIDLICPHGHSEYSVEFELLDDTTWEGISVGEGDMCQVCNFIKEHNCTLCCPSCGCIIPILSEEERIEFFKDNKEYLSDTTCPSCGSSWFKKDVKN